MNWLESVKVGDKVIVRSSGNEYVEVVTRVTTTQVDAGNHTFDRRTGRERGSTSAYYRRYLEPPTDEAVQRIRTRSAISWLRHAVNWEGYPPDLVLRVYQIVKGATVAKDGDV